MPIFSLPSEYGIGGFGKECFEFIDMLSFGGQKLWQILPLVQTGYGNSPYSSVSAESFNPYFISPEKLVEKGLLTEEEIAFSKYDGKYIDYGFLYSVRYPMLRQAYARFDKTDKKFVTFVKNKKAFDYALYMSIKYASGQKHFYEWEEGLKRRDPSALSAFIKDYQEEIDFWQFIQFEAESEWIEVKKYANKKGIKIIGDMPLYVALDSVDVWINPQLFKLTEDFVPTEVAGVPPDYFQADGQLWGNPVYDYDVHMKDDFAWWTNRIKNALGTFDYVRIDHFRALDRYYSIKYGEPTARNGEWIKVPSDELFTALHKKIDKSRIIAEDLGIIDDGVRELLKSTGYPGMKILSFAFNGEPGNLYLPQNIEENSVCYTGTHDNDTLMGLIENASEWDKNNLINGVTHSYLKVLDKEIQITDDQMLMNCIIELGFACDANILLLPMHDLLKKGPDYRINEPGTVKPQNWAVKFDKKEILRDKFEYLSMLTSKYNR